MIVMDVIWSIPKAAKSCQDRVMRLYPGLHTREAMNRVSSANPLDTTSTPMPLRTPFVEPTCQGRHATIRFYFYMFNKYEK